MISLSLLHCIGIPTDSGIPPEILPITNLCGRLPLAISVVAGLIKTFEFQDGWAAAVLEMLQEDRRGAMHVEAGNLSTSEIVVARSLKSLGNANATQLFTLLSVCPEDASIPIEVAALIWSTQVAEAQKHSSVMMKVRKLLALLIDANLLMGKIASFSLHDIGRTIFVRLSTRL